MKCSCRNRSVKYAKILFVFFLLSTIIVKGQSYLTTESFDGTTFPPTGWSISGSGWSRVTTGTYPTTTPHSGAGMAKFNSYNLSSGTAGILVSKSFDLSTSGMSDRPVINFWMYRDDGYPSNSDRIEFYINTTGLTDEAYYLGVINRNTGKSPIVSSTGWYNYSFTLPSSFTGSANYILIRGISTYGNNMFLDDVQVLDPPSIEVTSSTTEQVSENTIKVGSINNKIIRLTITTDGMINPFNLTNIKFSTSGSTNTADISSAKVYYTTNTTFTTTTQFGTTYNMPNGEFNIIGNQSLIIGINYLWLVYDIAESGAGGNVVDAQCLEFTIDKTGNPVITPDITNPNGNATLVEGLRGTKTIANSGGDYTSLYAAVADLNTSGVGPGGVTFLITDGQAFDEPGLVNITETGTDTRPIVFKQSGVGTKPILKFTGTSANSDAAIKISGGDYITFEGLEIRDDNSTNNVEYGLYFYALTANGCSYNMVKNCVINLYANYRFTTGIYMISNSSGVNGKNSYNKFYNNTITECYKGYYFEGNYQYYDEYNEIGTIDGGVSEIKSLGGNESYVIYGIYCNYQKDVSIYNTKLIDFISSGTYFYGIYLKNCYSGTAKVYNNELNNFGSTNSSIDGYIYGIVVDEESVGNVEIYNNIITNFTSDSESFWGMEINGALTKIFNNKMFNICYTGSGYKGLKGISVSKKGTHNIYNNMIYDFRSPNSAPYSASYPSVYGFYIGTANSANFTTYLDHNTVFFNYISANVGNRSTAIFIESPSYYANTIVLRNNIFVNNTNVATGALAVAMWYSGITYTNLSTLSNNNLYYTDVPSSKNLIFYDNTNSAQTIQQYRTRMVTKDQICYTELPPFASTENPYDVHIKADLPTQVEGGGQQITSPITITKDIDDEDRTTTAPDLGADEGTFTFGNDGISPAITYTLLEDAVVADSRIVTGIIISDKSGVNVNAGTKPRLYYKKSTDENTFNDNTNGTAGWKYAEAVNELSPFEFIIDFTKLISYPLIEDNTIQYFIIAQDLAVFPNVAINSGTFNTQPASVNLIAANFPISGTINSFLVREGLQGEFLIGNGETYTALSSADGIFNKINNSIVTGNITLKITSNTNETGAVPLNGFDQNYSVTIKPNDASLKVLAGTYNGGLIRFNGADNVIIDGRYEGSGNFLSFYNSAEANAIACFQFISLGIGAGSQNNTIRNCNIYTNSFYYNNFAIFIGGSTAATTSTGADNNNINIINNKIYKTKFGICIAGNSSAKPKNILIENNTIGYKETKYFYIGQYGIYLEQVDSSAINNNEIFNVINYNYNLGKLRGIYIGDGVQNLDIAKNKLYNILYQHSSDRYGAGGIEINTKTASSNIKIINNSIGRINGSSASNTQLEYSIFGIGVFNNSGGIKIFNNSICIAGTNSSVLAVSTGLYFSANASGIELKNNSITNSITFSTNTTSKSYAIYSDANAGAFTSINYNNYFSSGSQSVLGYFGGAKTTIEEWRLATEQDFNSLSADPLYLNDNNLKPLNTSPLLMAGIPIENILTDINGVNRHISSPTIGAYELGTEIPVIDWCNLETGNSTTIEGITTSVYSKIFEEGLTENMDQGANIQCWIGYSPVNSDPSTWPDSVWLIASYNVNGTEINGRDDYYKGMGIKSNGAYLPGGTYYIASRFKIKYSAYKYGGYSINGGGFWDGTSNVSGILTITDPVITWANYDTINVKTLGQVATGSFYGNVVVDGITTLNSSSSARIKAWIGFSELNTNPATWADSTIWTPATISAYRTTYSTTKDQYKISFKADLELKTYYVAVKYQLDSDPVVYGGYSTNGGGIWDGVTNTNGIVEIVESNILWVNLETKNQAVENNEYVEISGGVKIDGVTDKDDPCEYIKAWIGFSPGNTNPNTWLIWKDADFSNASDDKHFYIYDGKEPVGVGTFYYTFRFQFGNDEYVYAGYSTDSGGIWNGTSNISGVLTVSGTLITSFPYFQGFESLTFPPAGWRQEADDWEVYYWEQTDFSYNGNFAAGVTYNHSPEIPAGLISSKISLGSNMRIKFWWLDQDLDYYSTSLDKSLSSGNDHVLPSIIGHDTTYFEISTNHGGTWTTLAWLSQPEDELVFHKQIVNLSAYANKTVVFRWRDQTDATALAYGTILDNISIEKIPDQNNLTVIQGNSTNQINFGTTGATLTLAIGNSGPLNINVDRIPYSPGGTLPGGLVTMAPRYWIINIDEGTLDDSVTYTITLDLTGVEGISDYSVIHLLKRENSTEDWVDYGVPDDISAAPILKWTGLTSFSEFGLGSTENNAFPVELNSFSATTNGDCVNLNWSTAAEINVNGFSIERTINKTEKEWENIGFVQAQGNSFSVNEYNFADKMVTGGTKFIYRLKIVDNDDSYKYSKEINVEITPATFELFQNYPNPFNPETIIKFSLPKPTKVYLALYNSIGQLVEVLINTDYEAGYYNYLLNASLIKGGLASGVYYYRIITPEFNVVKKLMIIK
ncbi:MAG: BNR-repeat neuraminidase N-terminal domain-containing protein [bacterium]